MKQLQILILIIGSINPLFSQKIKITNETTDVITNIVVVNHETGLVDTLIFKPNIKLKKKDVESLIFVSEYQNEYLFFKQKEIVIRDENLYSYQCIIEDLGISHLYFKVVNNTNYSLLYFYVKYIHKDTFDKCSSRVDDFVITPGSSSMINTYINRYNGHGEDQLKDQLVDIKVVGINDSGELKSFEMDNINVNDDTIVVEDMADK